MAFTRKMLKALGIEEEKIEQIMDAHVEVVDAIKQERDTFRAAAEKLPELQQQLDAATQQATGNSDYKAKFEALVAENQQKEARAAKTAAYRGIMKDIGVGDAFADLLIRANSSDIDALELEGDHLKNAEDLKASLQQSMAPYIATTHIQGTTVSTPPAATGGRKTRDEIMAIKDADARQREIAENMDLFK